MPCYAFQCRKCSAKYDELLPYDATGKYRKAKCPRCKSKSKTKLVTHCLQVLFKNPRGTSKGDSFSYVAGFNMEQAKETRRIAEGKSHVGTSPYPDVNDVGGFDFSKI